MRTLYACTAIALLLIANSTLAQQAQPLNAPEKILYNAKIFTADAMHPFAEAVAIRGNTFIAVGNLAEVKAAAGKNAVLIDMHGQCILPGLIDSHNHAIEGGEGLLRANVNDSTTTVEQLAAYADEVRKSGLGMIGNVLVIEGLNIETWSHIEELAHTFNNGAYEKLPVLLRGSDGHTAWANATLANTAGINKAFIQGLPESKRKYFGYAASFEPNGFFADSGFYKVNAVLPDAHTDYKKAGVKAMEYNNSLGITALLDPAAGNMHSEQNNILDAYQTLSKSNLLTAHISAVVVADANGNAQQQIDKLKALQKKYNSTTGLRVLGFKIFGDGVIEYPTQTAAISVPYTNSGAQGALMFDPQKFANFVTLADKQGLLVHVHAIGDLTVTETLNGFEAARKANGYNGLPHTITHIQIARPQDFARFKQLHVLASLQLLWALGDPTTIDIVKPYIAPELYRYQYPARSLLQAGATICGASDWNVSTANPFMAIYEAETRRGKLGVLDSTQCMPRQEMLYAYTINAAKALMQEKNIGSITPGKYADLVLVDRDVLTVNPEAMKETKVLWTMFEGKLVYESK